MPARRNDIVGVGIVESIEQVLSLHLGKCNKTAMIIPQNMALQLFSILKGAKQPVFFGKDIIAENLMGYTYYGYFPQKVLLRIKFSFNSGIVEWWQNYIKWLVVLKTKKEYDLGNLTEYYRLINGTSTNNGTSGVFILSMIPGFGLLLSLAAFIFHDCDAIKVAISYLWQQITTVRNSTFWQKCKSCSWYSTRKEQHKVTIRRLSLPKILIK